MDTDIKKNYKESHHQLRSREDASLELNGLLMRLTEKIGELSVEIRSEPTEDKQRIEEINVLKIHRKNVEDLLVRIQPLNHQNYRLIQSEVQQIFDTANNFILAPRNKS